MTHGNTTESSVFSKIPISVYAGAIASFVTQPLQVIKTNLISYPSVYFRDMHKKIINSGWKNYMRGGSLAVMRQGYGFTVYTSMLNMMNKKLDEFSAINKYYRYSAAAFLSKAVSMTLEAPLTLLKTRVQLIDSLSVKSEFVQILRNPRQTLCKGLNATLVRESVYSLLHYATYRFLKDEIFYGKLGIQSSFIPAFIAGTIAISFSQPFEVIRSRVSVETGISITDCGAKIYQAQGWRGFFMGYLPRLCRKPLNSGICWCILDNFQH